MNIYDRFIPAPYVSGRTIAETWPKALALIVATGHIRGEVIDQRGDETYEVLGLQVVITDPLRDMIPHLPRMPGVTAWGDKARLDEYFETEIIGTRPKPEGFSYVYADWIAPELRGILYYLKDESPTRQVSIPIGGEDGAMYYENPACLRSIQFLIRAGNLDMITTWRSRDYAGAAATNMYGLIKLQEHVAGELEVQVGRYIDFSASAHVRVGSTRSENDRGDLFWVEKVIA